jgi:predicted AlkP superfamily phosphohydrolase/phosphomutase
MGKGSHRILVLGLDGLEHSLCERYMADGRMPNLTRLSARAATARLAHGPAIYSGLAWEHFSSGQAPDASRRWSAARFDPAAYDARQMPTTMTPFTEAMPGRAVVFDAPYFDLSKAPRTRGFVGWGAHDPGVASQARPSGLADEIAARFGPYPAADCIYGFTWPSCARTEDMAGKLVRSVECRAQIARWLLAERLPDWDLGLVVVSELHSIVEPMWHGVDPGHALHAAPSSQASAGAVARVYEAVDRLIGLLADAFPDALLVTFAMHGMGPNKADVPAMALLPELLYRHRFGRPLLRPRIEWTQAFPAPLGETEAWEWAVNAQFGHHSDGANRMARRWRYAKARLQSAMTAALARTRQDGLPIHWMPAMGYRRYWPDMAAFALPAYYNGRVRINLEGRERKGKVARADYSRVCGEIEALVRACRDARTGAPAIAAVERFCADDPLCHNDTEADLEVMFEGSATAWEHPEHGVIGPFPYRRTGGHTGAHGFAWFSGEGVAPRDLGSRSSFDVVPTLFELMGQDPPAHLSGFPIPLRDAA